MRPTLATTAAGLCIALLLLGGQPQGPTGCLAEIREAWSYVKVREHAYMFWWLMFADTPEYQAAPLIIWLQGASPSMPSSSDEADSDTERADPPSRTTSLKSRNSHIASPGSERPESEEDFPESDNEPVTSSGGRLGSSAGSAMEAPAAAPEAQEQRNSADPSQKFPAREPHAPADEEAFSSDHASQQGFPGDFLTLDDDMGGPGASSAGFGNFAEIGPLDVQLLPRNHSWVRFANLLFVDNPVGSGYSFVTNETGFAVNNSQIASDLVTMISVFLAKMPEFQNVPLYIFSESYGGKMAAEFALQLYKAHASGKVLCKLSGVALGDGWLSPLDSTSTWGQYLYTMSFLDKTNLMTLNKVVGEIRQALVAKDGAKATSLWASAEDIVEQLTNGIDWYNILLPQQEQSASLGALSLPSDNTIGRAFVRHVAHFYNIFNGTLTELMNGPIKEKLGSIPKNVTWGGQSGAVFQALKADFMLPAVDAVDRLLNETDVTVAVYSGQLDLIVDALGTLQWMEQLRWPGMKEFQATAKKPMVVEGETAGYYKSFKNLTLYWVLKAGHMVPADAPLAAQSMARHITMGKW